MKEYKKQVSIIMVNYNTKELTKKAIQAVFDKTEGVEYEIIVVDNDYRYLLFIFFHLISLYYK